MKPDTEWMIVKPGKFHMRRCSGFVASVHRELTGAWEARVEVDADDGEIVATEPGFASWRCARGWAMGRAGEARINARRAAQAEIDARPEALCADLGVNIPIPPAPNPVTRAEVIDAFGRAFDSGDADEVARTLDDLQGEMERRGIDAALEVNGLRVKIIRKFSCPHCGNRDLDTIETNGEGWNHPDLGLLCTKPCHPDESSFDSLSAPDPNDRRVCGCQWNPYDEC